MVNRIICIQHNKFLDLPDIINPVTTTMSSFINTYFYLKYKKELSHTEIYKQIESFCDRHRNCGIQRKEYP